MGKLTDYLAYGLAGAALGTGGGAGFNYAAHGKQKPFALAAGAGVGATAGALVAYMKNKNRVNPKKLGPGWYIVQRPMMGVPDLGVYARHSGNLIILPKEQADRLLSSEEWKSTSHKDFKGKAGQELTAFTFGGYTGGDRGMLSVLGHDPMDIRFSVARKEMKMPITDITKVPLKANVSLVDAMKRLKKIDNIYSVLGEPDYKAFPKDEPGIEKAVATNCHGITSSILRDTEDLHNLKEWSPNGMGGTDSVRYVRTDAKQEALQAVIDKKYIPEMLRAGTAGGVMGGALLGGIGGLYGSYDVNKRLNPMEEKIKGVGTIGSMGLLGAIGGGVTGMVGRGIQLAREKHKAKKELQSLTETKEAAFKDYMVHGMGGAAIGTAAGALGNLALGRDMLDHRLLLGGMGLGAAAGLYSGNIRSREREQQETFAKNKEEMIMRDANGVPLKSKEGKYIPRYGTYVVIRPIGDRLPIPSEMAKSTPGLSNTAGHAFQVTYSPEPITTTHNIKLANGVVKPVTIHSVKYTTFNGKPIYAMYQELDNDSVGGERRSRAVINNMRVTPESIRAGKFEESSDTAFDDILNYNPDDPSYAGKYGVIVPIAYDDKTGQWDGTRATNRMNLVNNRMLQNGGDLGRYDLIQGPVGRFANTTNNCYAFMGYLVNNLRKRNLADNDLVNRINRIGVAFGVNMKKPEAFDKTYGQFDNFD